jgi:signal transduction histidine kinase
MNVLNKLREKIATAVDRYPLVIAGIAIYVYYLFTSVDLFEHRTETRSFFDYLVQFDSLLFMWLATAAFIQVQKYRKVHKKEEERLHEMERILDKQKIYDQLLGDITTLLQDRVNNPLAIISVTSHEIRKKFEKDMEIMKWLDRIDGAVQRIENSIRDIHAYEARKIIETTHAPWNNKSSH